MRTPSPLHARSTLALHGEHDSTFLAVMSGDKYLDVGLTLDLQQ